MDSPAADLAVAAPEATDRFGWDAVLAPLRSTLDGGGFAGAVVGVALPDGTTSIQALGEADREGRRAMTPETLFWIASLTKSMTSTLVMTLVDEGKLELDRPVETYLPNFRGQRVARWFGTAKPRRPVAVVDLMRHLSGLPAKFPTGDRPLDRMTSEEKAQLAASARLVASPGGTIEYSNLNYECLGRLVEVAAGAPFEACLSERLLEPLGMCDTTFRPSVGQLARLALPYAKAAETKALERRPFILLSEPFDDPARTPTPAFGLFSTAADCLRFCRLHLGRGTFDGRRIFSEAAAERMLKPFDQPVVAQYQGVAWSLSPGAACISGMYGAWMTLYRRHDAASLFLSASADFQTGPVWNACHDFAAAVGEELASQAQNQRRELKEARRQEFRRARRGVGPGED